MKLALGTAQFGLHYGVSNQTGQVSQKEVERILTLAKSAGISTLDTASAYGTSECVLGDISLSQHFSVVTKIPALNESTRASREDIGNSISNSLKHLQRKNVNGIMFHDANDLIHHDSASIRYNTLAQAKVSKQTQKIGVSVYNPVQAEYIINTFAIDIIQLPLNLLDQRFIMNKTLQKLKENQVETHCRSIFLQGLLLMKNEKIDDYFIPFKPQLERIWHLAKKMNTSMLSLTLSIAKYNQYIDKVVVGCCSERQLNDIINAYHNCQQNEHVLAELASNDERLILPSNWQLGA